MKGRLEWKGLGGHEASSEKPKRGKGRKRPVCPLKQKRFNLKPCLRLAVFSQWKDTAQAWKSCKECLSINVVLEGLRTAWFWRLYRGKAHLMRFIHFMCSWESSAECECIRRGFRTHQDIRKLWRDTWIWLTNSVWLYFRCEQNGAKKTRERERVYPGNNYQHVLWPD